MKTQLGIIGIILSFAAAGYAQTTPFTTTEYLDVNRFNAAHMVHGDMWRDLRFSTRPFCEYPKGSGKHANFLASIWMSGEDLSGQLHVAGAMYRKGNDYWPGPLDASGTLSYATSRDWARIWKVNRKDILDFLALPSRTLSTIPAVILEWPAKGNVYARGGGGAGLTITTAMAPFVDVNTDGIYNPLDGDYPDMKGDQMLWWLFSDNGPTHNQTNGRPLKIEYHAMAYAYSRGTVADNILFYEFEMHNKSSDRYSGFRFGLFSDADIGYAYDDYLAFDSVHRMGINYNAVLPDNLDSVNSYGYHPPMTGLSFIEMPGDNYPATILPAGNFSYFENAPSGYLRDPFVDTQYHNYMHGKNIIGNAYFEGRYAFPITKGDVECDSGDAPKDRRYVIATNDYVFQPNTIATVAMAFMATDTVGYACPVSSFDPITKIADSAWYIYYNPPPPLSQQEINLQRQMLQIYPNPASGMLYVKLAGAIARQYNLLVYDVTGRKLQLSVTKNGNMLSADISALAPGVYSLVYDDGIQRQAQTFVKR